MKRTSADALDSGYTGDFALIETDGDYVVLEANEWDGKASEYRSGTLYPHRDEAKFFVGCLARVVVDGSRHITPQFTGGKKHSEERTTLFDVRVKLPC